MAYDDSCLWKRAFIEKRDDASSSEQEFFKVRYSAMRSKVSQLVSLIPSDLPEMTVHDITHLDALWEMGSIVTKDKVDLNPPEAFVFGAAVLIHDAAMTVYAYSGGLQELKETTAWKDAVARLRMVAQENNIDVNDLEIENTATKETLRLLHAKQAEKIAVSSWKSGNCEKEEYLIDDPEVRMFYGTQIGRLAHSHWWSLAEIADEFGNGLGALGGETQCDIDLVKVACLLRVSDAMHIDSRRAPSFMHQVVNPSGISEHHWTFQQKMAVPVVRNEVLQYSAASPFDRVEADAWWLAFDTISLINKELREADLLFQRLGRNWRFKVKGVVGTSSPSEMSQFITTEGWDPVDCSVRVSDVPKIVAALGGEKLYGSDTSCAIRELIQNSADAVVMRRMVQQREPDWGSISIRIEKKEEKYWLAVEDTGIGMSPNVMTGPLVDFGNSFWRSPLAAREFPGIHAAGASTIGRYGIGFFAVFMLGERVLVTSRRYDQADDSARTLEFKDGLGSRPILYDTPDGKAPMDGGTRVEVCLDIPPRFKDGILASNQFGSSTIELKKLVGFLAPNLDVNLYVSENDENEQIVISANDWIDLEDSVFIKRLTGSRSVFGEKVVEKDGKLRLLEGPDGEVYGRASIRSESSWRYDNIGCVSVGGLRSCSVNWITGLLQGKETTASRNSAEVNLPPEVLAEWSSEQARLLESAKLEDKMKAYGAAVVLLCGGDIGKLPIVRYKGVWHSKQTLRNLLGELDEVVVLFESEIRYDEQTDFVHPMDFKDRLEECKEIVFVPDDFPESETRKSVKSLFQSCQAGYPNAWISDIFRRVLKEVWVDVFEHNTASIVGIVDDVEIEREVTRFSSIFDFE